MERGLKKRLGIQWAGIACVVTLAGCATNDQGVLVIDPNKVNQVLVAAVTPPPPPVVVAAPVVEEAYMPAPDDVYIAGVVDRDVVIVGGDTYIWVVGSDGVRHRHFYAHGDHRQDVFHRRENLRQVMAHHDGHLPDHPAGAHAAGARPGMEHAPAGGAMHAGPAGAPVNRAVVANRAAPAKPAPGKPAPAKDKKS
jgi:hypothetical protein